MEKPVARGFVFFLLGAWLLSAAPHPPGLAAENLRESAVVRAVRRASPAVVNLSTVYEVRTRAHPFSGFASPFFEEFFRDFFDPRLERRREHTSLGSGVIIDGERGLILTNAHVIQHSGTIRAVLLDEREFEARIVGADPDSDLAVLQIASPERLPSIPMGRSDDLLIGETVIAIGNPFGFSHTVTTGVISALNRSVRTDERVYQNFIQTDASINPGNSGGPLLNIEGALIGINTAIYAKAQGIGFAIPIDRARRIVADLLRYGEVKPAWIGMLVEEIDERATGPLGYPARRAVRASAVEQESPAAAAGLRPGDIVVAIGGKRIATLEDYYAATRPATAGEVLEIQYWRKGETRSVRLRVVEFPLERADRLAWEAIGVRVADLDERSRRTYRIAAREGALITEVRPGSPIARAGVRAGDVIRQVDDGTVAGREDFRRALARHREKATIVLLVQRGEQGYYLTLPLRPDREQARAAPGRGERPG
ncbi:MAG: trypsin-like peptidase domain-containing protein [Desulfobacterales bacterium]